MAKIGKSELKTVIAAMKRRTFLNLPGDLSEIRPAALKGRRSAAKLAESFATNVGFESAKIRGLVAADRKAQREAFNNQLAAAAKGNRAALRKFRSATAARLEALQILGKPFASTLINIDRPFLIWQLPKPQLNIFTDSQIASMNSSVRVLVNTDRDSNKTRFTFFYLWSNDTDFAAVVNVGTSLILNGSCMVQADAGIFSGNTSTLMLSASLFILRWSGWGRDPVTGESNDQTFHPGSQSTQRQNILNLRVKGGHIFESPDDASKSFNFEPFTLSHSLLVVPARAVVLFHVNFEVSYSMNGGGNLEDRVFADFSENGNGVFCPNLELEVLTPLANLSALSPR